MEHGREKEISENTGHRRVPVNLCENDLKNMCGRYHFKDTGLALLKEVYEKYCGAMCASVYFHVNYKESKNAAVLMTLGEDIDRQQSLLMEEERLSEAYALDCLAMELLAQAYLSAEEILHEITGLWCGKYCFPGSSSSLEGVAVIVDAMKQGEIHCNEAFVLIPKKSTAYTVELEEESSAENEGKEQRNKICDGCKKSDCPNRNEAVKRAGIENENRNIGLNYGYRRIFGEGKERHKGK